ncbi:MAG TPA: hypothetical protein VF173_00925 [Thermoanaerobaculia bacterium]|nr:hypothetical protein [Thermoanaerobaculia bacterium]
MKSREPSDPFDLPWNVPTTSEDIQALRENQPRLGENWWEQLQIAVDQLPGVEEALRKRPTFAGCAPFEL